MGVHKGAAELHVVFAMAPGEIVLPLPAAPGVRPGPPARVITDVVGRSEGDSRQFVIDVCREEVWYGVSRRLLEKAHVVNVEVVAVEVEGGLIQKGWADGIRGVNDTLPRR